jgi:hypothetical protein
MESEELKEILPFTEDDVLHYLRYVLTIQKTRVRNYVDPRNYLIAILFYKFNNTEEDIASHTTMQRSTISHAKKQAYDMIQSKDAQFLKHTEEVRILYPCELPKPIKNATGAAYTKMVQLHIFSDKALTERLKNLGKVKNMKLSSLCKHLILTSLELVENMRAEHLSNPYYQSGYVKGKNIADTIDVTKYKSLENAIIIKEQLLEDFTYHFKWDMRHKDYAECKGSLDALRDVVINKSKTNEQGSNSNSST